LKNMKGPVPLTQQTHEFVFSKWAEEKVPVLNLAEAEFYKGTHWWAQILPSAREKTEPGRTGFKRNANVRGKWEKCARNSVTVKVRQRLGKRSWD